jgi:mono/diheme cytochrome c family protein
MMKAWIPPLVTLISVGGASSVLAAAPVDFVEHIRPILEANCYQCHGEKKQKSKLRLDSPANIRKGGESGEPPFVAGKRAGSFLYKLVSRVDPDEAMPPKEKDALSKEEVERIGLWIDQGAKMPGDGEAVALTTDHWSFQPVPKEFRYGRVDGFLGEALKAKGLGSSPRGDRRTLIRRLYLVMLGLPPTPEDVELFVRDKSPHAWAVLVERVLASPHYGERMARHWLDIIRFAESNGFETNRERPSAWHFRDYIIESFNEDKPYDQFVQEHIAGDALGADIGTGFLVAGPYDVVKSPDVSLTLMQRQDELADMINTTGTAFLGLTLGCARCHNHKFDPVTQRDYYSMQAIFAGVGFGERVIKVRADQNVKEKVAKLRVSLAATEAELGKLRGLAAQAKGAPSAKRPPVKARGNVESFPTTTAKFVRFTINRSSSSEPCIDELQVFSPRGENVALGGVASSSGTLPGYPIHKLEHINDGKFGNGRSWISNEKGKGWVQIEFAKAREVNRIEWARDREGRFADRVAIDYKIELSSDGKRWIPAAHSGDREPFGGKAEPNAFVAKLPGKQAARARALLSELKTIRAHIATIEQGAKGWVANFSQPGATHRLYRGDPMAKREEVPPDALGVIGSLNLAMDAPERERRVALAKWIASPDNPLTARVAVNRWWQFVFGTGLVDTPSDFGKNGTLPTHPELLDWLAGEFVANGWSVKEMMRMLLNSAAFQQSSRPNVNAARVDADGRYLWRFPPRRLEAEAIRDSILLAAGTLDRRMGGPGFHLFEVDRENVVHYHAKEETGPAEWRRMIYLYKIRQEQDAVFGVFDCPDGNQVIPKRNRSTTPLQALNLLNSHFTMQQAEKLAARVGEGEKGIRMVYEILYGRAGTAAEVADAVSFAAEHGLVAFCRAMLNTNEFLFVF